MKTYTIIALVLATYLACVSAQYRPNRRQTGVAPAPQTGTEPSTASTLSTYIVDFLTKKIQFLFELFDIKVRTIRFLSSLYTTENLVLLKKVMNVAIRVGNWLYSVIPDSTTESHSYLLSILFPQLNQEDKYQDFSSEDPALPFSKDEPPEVVMASTTAANIEEEEDEDEDDNVLDEQIRNLNSLINGNRYSYY